MPDRIIGQVGGEHTFKRRRGLALPVGLPLAILGVLAAHAVPQLIGVERQSNSEILLRTSATAGEHYRLDVTNDLSGWNGLATVRSAGNDQFTDTGAPKLDRRFYRAEAVAGGTVLTGDHIQTGSGDVIIHPVNHASFGMSWNGKMIYNDPVGSSGLYSGFPKADLILVSHGHGDHFNNATLDAVRNTGAVIVAPQAVWNSMTAALRLMTTVLANGASTSAHGVTIDAVPAYNSNHPQGVGNGYVVTLGGKRFYMAGDTGFVAEMSALTNIEVAFICMNEPFTMTVTAAVSAVRSFSPRIVYPYHFRNQNGTFADLNSFKQQVSTNPGTEVRIRTWY
jgi:L-ascorbate metabolism protein UlaG (beta-lactamase superfamily)